MSPVAIDERGTLYEFERIWAKDELDVWLSARNPSGALIWKSPVGSIIGHKPNFDRVVVNASVVAVFGSAGSKEIIAFDRANGSRLWSVDLASLFSTAPEDLTLNWVELEMDTAAGKFLVSFYGQSNGVRARSTFRVLDERSGRLLYQPTGYDNASSAIADPAGAVYTWRNLDGGFGYPRDEFVALEDDGGIRWRRSDISFVSTAAHGRLVSGSKVIDGPSGADLFPLPSAYELPLVSSSVLWRISPSIVGYDLQSGAQLRPAIPTNELWFTYEGVMADGTAVTSRGNWRTSDGGYYLWGRNGSPVPCGTTLIGVRPDGGEWACDFQSDQAPVSLISGGIAAERGVFVLGECNESDAFGPKLLGVPLPGLTLGAGDSPGPYRWPRPDYSF